jgi:U4/U6.U5 tri-snRNP-associated protein 1
MNLILSVEDTNRLRAQVNLKPIPIPEQSKNKSQLNNNNNNNNNVQIIELSVQETNKLRKQLNLKLLIDESNIDDESRNYLKLKEEELKNAKISKFKTNLEEKKNTLKTKQRLEKGGILDRINGKSDVMDFDLWFDKVGKDIKKHDIKKLKFKDKKKNSSDTGDDNDNNNIDEKIDNITEENGLILTAKDTNVLDDIDKEDEFENKQLERDENTKKSIFSKTEGGKLVSIDTTKENEQESFKGRKFDLLDLESDHEVNDDENDASKISKLFKRDISKFKKLKKSKSSSDQNRKKIFDTELIDKKFNHVILNDIEEDSTDDIDDLNELLSNTRNSNLKKRKIDYDDFDTNNNGNLYQNGETFNENLDFLDNFKVDASLENTETVKKIQNHITRKEIINDAEDKKVEDQTSYTSTRYKALLESENEKNFHSYGVSNILNVLKATSSKESEKTENDVKIVYTDDNGKLLTTKEAFKHLSHKFHGSKKQ